jgi:hypothetical protein
MIEDILVPIVAMAVPICVVAIVFFYKYQHRKFLHEERLAMIEKGLAPEDMKELAEVPITYPRNRSLYGGITTTAVGLALLLGLGTIGYGPWLLGGLIPLAVGIGSIIAYVATPGEQKKNDQTR